jgi:hypothetical protein
VRFGVRHNIVKKTASQRGQGRQDGGVLRLSQELDDRLRNLTAPVTFNQATGEDLVRFACDLLSVDIDPPPAVELAGLRFDVPMQDAEPPFRDLVIALGRPEMPEHQAGWVLVRMLAEQMVANSVPPAIGAHQLWGLWWLCDQAPESEHSCSCSTPGRRRSRARGVTLKPRCAVLPPPWWRQPTERSPNPARASRGSPVRADRALPRLPPTDVRASLNVISMRSLGMRLFTPLPKVVLPLNEGGSVGQVHLLPWVIDGEETPRHYSGTVRRAAIAGRNVGVVKCVQPIVDCDFFPSVNVSPCEDSNTTSHGIGIARVI